MDDEQVTDGTVEVPAFPFVESAAIADAMEMAAQIAESSAQFLRGYALRMQASHNWNVEQEDAMVQAAAELEKLLGGDSDG